GAPVALDIRALEIPQQPAPLADQHQKPAPRVMILAVRAQMLRELVDPRREQSNLDLGRTGVRIPPPVLGDDLLLLLRGKAHVRRETVAGVGRFTWPFAQEKR